MFRSLTRLVRTYPKTTVSVLLLFLFVASAVGFYGYALYEWHAAQVDVKEGRAEEARNRLEICLWVWSQSADVHLLAARAARLTGHLHEAEAHLKKCMTLKNGATEATQLEFLLMRAQSGEEDEVAPPLFALVDDKHPESPMIMETLARAYMHHLRYGLAFACLNRWIKSQPAAAKPLHWRGWVLERMNKHKFAMEDYQKALQLDPDLVAVRLRLAEMLLEDKQPLKAIRHLERLMKQVPDRPDVMARLGQCLFLQGQDKEARRLLERAVLKLPNDPPLLLHLAKLDLQQAQAVRAEKWLLRSLKVDPLDTEAQYTLISCLQLQNRRKEATQALAKYKRLKVMSARINDLLKEEAKKPSHGPDSPSEIGSLLLHAGQEKLGVYWLHQALDRDPAHQSSHKVLADYYEKKGDKKRAAVHRRQATADRQKTKKQE